MVATTFAADTPLALSGLAATQGIAANWFWWCQIPAVFLGIFFYAHLWKRSGVASDNEFIELRYSGSAARVLRVFRALYLVLVYNCLVMGWVNLAMVKVVAGLVPPESLAIATIDPHIEQFLRTAGAIPSMPTVALGRTASRSPAHPVTTWVNDNQELLVEFEEERLLTLPLGGFAPPTLEQVVASLDGLDMLDARLVSPSLGPLPARDVLPPQMVPVRDPLPAASRAEAAGSVIDGYASSPGERAQMVLTAKCLLIFTILVCMYCGVGGLWSVVVTDFLQFIFAMGGSIFLAWLVLSHFGGPSGLMEALASRFGPEESGRLTTIWPTIAASHDASPERLTWGAFGLFAGISWWAVGFADGGGYLAQRMLAARSERDAARGYLLFAILNFGVRMWPWLLVGLAGACWFPNLAAQQVIEPSRGVYDPEMNYVYAMRLMAGPGVMGFLMAGFIGAYMSTISTHVNLAASYLLNDIYRPLLPQGAPNPRRDVWLATGATLLVTVAGMLATLWMRSIKDAWFLLASLQTGIGLVYLLRWYWWRINAWSEIACMSAAVVGTVVMQALAWGDRIERGLLASAPRFYHHWVARDGLVATINGWIDLDRAGGGSWADYPSNLAILVPFSMIVWMATTFLTSPTTDERLMGFYRRVRPAGRGWRHVAELCRRQEAEPPDTVPMPETDQSPYRMPMAGTIAGTVACVAALETARGLFLNGSAFAIVAAGTVTLLATLIVAAASRRPKHWA